MKNQTCESISKISIIVNLLLSAGKAAAGFIGHSEAMVADAVHSASDVISTIIVIIALKISRKSADSEHPYGHDRFESLASLVLVVMLASTGIALAFNAVSSLASGTMGEMPGIISLIAAVISIIVKEMMFRASIKVGKREKSDAVIADAWHHRSDALSSVGSLVGIILSRMGVFWADAAAGIIICFFILKTAFDIGKSTIQKLTDHACETEVEAKIRQEVMSVQGVKRIDMLRTRCFGSGYYVDIEIAEDPDITLKKAHLIAENVHDRLEKNIPSIYHCMVHVNPYE